MGFAELGRVELDLIDGEEVPEQQVITTGHYPLGNGFCLLARQPLHILRYVERFFLLFRTVRPFWVVPRSLRPRFLLQQSRGFPFGPQPLDFAPWAALHPIKNDSGQGAPRVLRGSPSGASNRAETRMNTGSGELVLCIKFRGSGMTRDAPPQSGAPSRVMPSPL